MGNALKDPTIAEANERVRGAGADYATDAELLVTLLKTPGDQATAYQYALAILEHFGGLKGLARAKVDDLVQLPLIGTGTAAAVVSAFELGRRVLSKAGSDMAQVTSPADAANMLMPRMSHLEQEHLLVIVLDTKHHVRRIETVYKGNADSIVIRAAEVFRTAVKLNAKAVLVAHNHPSGDPTPSPDDVRVTENLVQAGKLLDIEVLDHLVIGDGRYVSLKERGLGWTR